MKKRMKQLMALGLAVMLVLGGCGEEPVDESVIVTPEEEVVETIVQEVEVSEEEEKEEVLPLSVNVSTNNKTYYFEDGEQAYLYLQYCDVEVNGDEYTDLKKNVEKWSKERGEELQSLYKGFEELAALEVEGNENFYRYGLYQSLSTKRADGGVLSLREDTYQYSGGAYGMSYYEGINFDAKSGERLSLKDLVNDWENFSVEASACMIYYLKETYGEGLYEDYIETIENMWAEGSEPDWYLDGTSIVVVVQEYMVGPHAMGIPEIHLSYVDFGHYMKDEYLPGEGRGVAAFKENQELYLKLPGIYEEVPMMLQCEWTEESLNCSLWLGENEKPLEYCDVLKNAYLVKNEKDIYCLIEADMASDDYATYVYRLTEGVIEEVSVLDAAVDPGNINSEELRMESWVYLLGTYSGVKNYHFDENGKLVTEDKEYHLEKNSYALTTTVELPVLMDGEETESTLPAGSHIVLTATDEESYVRFVIQETGAMGTLEIYKDTNEVQKIIVGGVDENECFETLPYAG